MRWPWQKKKPIHGAMTEEDMRAFIAFGRKHGRAVSEMTIAMCPCNYPKLFAAMRDAEVVPEDYKCPYHETT